LCYNAIPVATLYINKYDTNFFLKEVYKVSQLVRSMYLTTWFIYSQRSKKAIPLPNFQTRKLINFLFHFQRTNL